MASTMTDFYMDILLQMISMVAYTTIIIRITWLFVPNRFPKLPADKKWPSYVITSLYFLIIVLLLTTFGLYYLDDSKDFGDEFREMDRVIEETEIHINNTIGTLPKIGDPETQLGGLSDNITEDIKKEIGLSVVEKRPEISLDFSESADNMSNWYFLFYKQCEGATKGDWIRVPRELLKSYDKIEFHIQDSLPKIVEKFSSPVLNLSNIISNEKMELENRKSRITEYLKPVKTFFKKIVSSLKISRNMFNQRKEESIKLENSKNVVLFFPFTSAILFAFLSIVTNIIWEKDMPCILSIILCILFHMLSIQIIMISTYFAYNIPADIFTQEPEYFKLFNFELSSYNNKSITNAYKTFLNCDDEKSTIISAQKNGLFISEYPLLRKFHDELLNTINYNLSDIKLLRQESVAEIGSIVESVIEEFIRLEACTDDIQKEKQKHIDFLNRTHIYVKLCLALSKNMKNLTYFTRSVIQEKINDINRTIYEPVFKINKTLIAADFKCQPLYNAFLNAYISSHQPDQNLYRDMFKITVMGGSTLCLILYLLALGKRINQLSGSKPKTENMDSDEKLGEAKKDAAPRSPKRC